MREMKAGISPFDPDFLALFEAMPEPVWLAYPGDGRIAFVNAAGLALLQLREDDVLENGWMHLLHPDEADAIFERVARTLMTGAPFDVECRMRDASGSYKWIRSRANALRDAEGNIAAFVGHLIDIDVYKRAEQEARNAETRLRGLLESPLIGFVRLDMHRVVVDCNDAFALMLGYTREEMLRRSLEDLTPPEWHTNTHAALSELREAGVTGPFKKEYFRKDGTRAPVLVTGKVDPVDPVFVNSFIVDLSAESQYREAFERARDINQTMLDSMPMMFWTADADGKITYWNKWFYAYTGLDSEQALNNGYWSIVHPDDLREIQPAWEQEWHSMPQVRSEHLRYRRASDGSYRWHLVHAEPLVGLGDRVQGWLGFSIDVHDQRRAAERSEFLLRTTERIAGLLDSGAVAQQVVRECVPMMGDSAVLFLFDDANELAPAAIAAVTPKREATLRALHATFKAGPPESPIYGCVREHRSIRLTKFGADAIDAMNVSREERDILKGLKTTSLLATPLFDEHGDIGVLLTNNGPSGRIYDEQDVQTLRVLGDRIVVAFQNAQRYAREHRVAEALQKASLPQSLPHPQGVRLSAHYAAAPSEAHIGGDWYDAVELADGRVVLSIGDVTGRGLEAAVTMANIRQIVRGIAHVHPDPALMLEAADRALRAEHPETYVTTFTCVIDPIESMLVYASAGHPPALLRKKSGDVVSLGSPGLPLGLRVKSEPSAIMVPIDRGDVLVLYTDGVTEVHHDVLEGENALVRCIEDGAVFKTGDPARAIYDELVGEDARDDIAILVATIGELEAATASRIVRRWTTNAKDQELMRKVRTEVLGEICFAKLAEDTVFRAEMVFSELIGNVVRHTPGTTQIVLERRRRSIVLHVLDDGEGFQFVPRLPLDAYSERGRGLFIAAQLSDDFSVTRRPQGGSHARALIAYT